MTSSSQQFPDIRRHTALPIIACLAIVLTGCGGGSDGGKGNNGGNQPPVAVDACSFTPENVALTGRLTASDPNNDPLTYTIVQQGTLGRAETDVAGNFRYTPNAGARGRDSFVFSVSDSAGNRDTANITMIVGYTRIMPLGDSITAGVTVGNGGCSIDDTNCPSEGQRVGYRKRLYDDLVAAGYYVQMVGTITAHGADAISPPNHRHEGHGGFQDSQIRDGVLGWLNAERPDVVLLHAGTNGINEPNGTSAADSAGGANSILERIFGQWIPANRPLTVLMAKIIGSPTPATNQNVVQFNTDLESRVNQNWSAQIANGRLHIIDMYSALSVRSVGNGGDFADQLHPNETGYQKMADAWRTRLIASGVLARCP